MLEISAPFLANILKQSSQFMSINNNSIKLNVIFVLVQIFGH